MVKNRISELFFFFYRSTVHRSWWLARYGLECQGISMYKFEGGSYFNYVTWTQELNLVATAEFHRQVIFRKQLDFHFHWRSVVRYRSCYKEDGTQKGWIISQIKCFYLVEQLKRMPPQKDAIFFWRKKLVSEELTWAWYWELVTGGKVRL